jgi:uncharacterized membrane protein
MWMGGLLVTQVVLVIVVFLEIRHMVGFLAFPKVCGFTSNISVELQAISHGLNLAWIPHTHPYVAIVDYIRSMLIKDRNIVLVHTLREGNSCAD